LIVEPGLGLYDQLFHASDAALAVANENGDILEANESFARLLDKSLSDITSLNVVDLLPDGTVTGRKNGLFPAEWQHGKVRFTTRPMAEGKVALSAHAAEVRAVVHDRLETLKESMSLAMQGGKLGTWSRDLQTGVVEWSPELEAIFGLAPGTFARNEAAFFDFIHPDDRERVGAAVEESLRTGKDYQVEFRFSRADKTEGWMEGRGRTLIGEDGKPWTMAGVGIDITDKKRAEKQLELSQSSYKHLVDIMPAAVCTSDANGMINFYNARATEIWGRSPVIPNPSEMYCGSFKLYTLDGQFIPPDENHPVAVCLRTGQSFRAVPARIERTDGTSVLVEVNIDPFRDAEGNIVGAINVFLDVTERVADRQEMQVLGDTARILSSTLDLPEIYDRLQALVARQFDCDNLIVSSYERTTNMVTCSYAWMEGVRADVTVFPPLQLAPEGKGMQSRVIRTGEPLVVGDATAARKQMCTKSVIVHSSGRVLDEPEPPEPDTRSIVMVPIKLHDEVTGVVQAMSNRPNAYHEGHARLLEGMVQQMTAAVQNAKLYQEAQREIAERKRLEEELEQRVKDRTAELEAAYDEMQGFTYSVSHDLRAPLRAIISGAMILLEDHRDQVSALAREELMRMANASSKLGRLIDDLLAYSRLSRTEIARRQFDMSAFVRDIVDSVATRHTHTMEVDVEDGMTAEADPLLLRLALENLVDNAFKYAGHREGGRIWIGRSSVDDVDAFYVRDNGVGFDQNYAPKIFLPFERLVLDSEFPGTGIGLANTKRIIDRHGGRIWAESQPGAGATFYFTLS